MQRVPVRVLCSTTAGDGHLGPLKEIASALVRAGHEVRFAAPVSFAGAVGRADLEHVPFADAPPNLLGPVMARLPQVGFDEAHQIVMREIFGRLDAQQALPGIRQAVAEWRPHLILCEPAEFGSLAVAVTTGIPHAEVAIGVAEMMVWARQCLAEPLAELDGQAGLPGGTLLEAMATAPVFTIVPDSVDTAGDGPTPATPAPPGHPVSRGPGEG